MAKTKRRSREQRMGSFGGMEVYAKPPPIRLRVPEIKIPEIKIPPINVPAADLGPVAAVVGQLSRALQQIAAQQNAILAAIQALAGKQIDIKLPKSEPRPRSYAVEFVQEDGETIGLRIEAD